MKTRKLLSVLLSIVMLISVLPLGAIPAFAAEPDDPSNDDVGVFELKFAYEDNYLRATLIAKNCVGMSAGKVTVFYDPDVLTIADKEYDVACGRDVDRLGNLPLKYWMLGMPDARNDGLVIFGFVFNESLPSKTLFGDEPGKEEFEMLDIWFTVADEINVGKTYLTVDVDSYGFDAIGGTYDLFDIYPSNGICGDNLTWALDENGTLTISGSGDMYDFGYTNKPWYEKREKIKNVIVEDGVTSIGNEAFSHCESLVSVNIPDSVTSIGKYAFDYCENLTDVYYTGSDEDWNNIEIKYGNDYLLNATLYYNYDPNEHMHIWGNGVLTKAATCAEEGEMIYTCTVCSETKTKIIEKTNNHTWDKDIIIKAATCAEKGEMIYICTVCGKENKQVIPRLEHVDNDENGVCDVCMLPFGVNIIDSGKCGDTVNWTLDESGILTIYGDGAMWNFDDADSTAPWLEYYEKINGIEILNGVTNIGTLAFFGCTVEYIKIADTVTRIEKYGLYGMRCPEIDLPKSVSFIGYYTFGWYDNGEKIIIRNPDCIIEDEGSGNGYIIIYGYPNSTAQKYAEKYNKEFHLISNDGFDEHEHTWNSGIVTKAATCAATGIKTYTCIVCGETKTENIAKTNNHQWDNGVVTKQPTTTSEGVKTYTCTVCKATKTEPIAKLTLIDTSTVKEKDGYVYSAPNLTAADVIKAAGNGAKILKADGTELKSTEKVGSGMTLVKPDGTKETIIVKGDNNGDGEVSTADARFALRTAVGLENPNAWEKDASEVDGNSGVSTSDARLILRCAVGLEALKLY